MSDICFHKKTCQTSVTKKHKKNILTWHALASDRGLMNFDLRCTHLMSACTVIMSTCTISDMQYGLSQLTLNFDHSPLSTTERSSRDELGDRMLVTQSTVQLGRQSLVHPEDGPFTLMISRSVRRSVVRTDDQLFNQMISCSIRQSVIQSDYQSFGQTISHSVRHSVLQSNNQPFSHIISHSVNCSVTRSIA